MVLAQRAAGSHRSATLDLPPAPELTIPAMVERMEFSVENVCGLLIRSKLLNPEEVRSMYARWQGEARDSAGSLPRFTRWLVANRYVTEYQAALVAQGHADSFFLGQYKLLDRLG